MKMSAKRCVFSGVAAVSLGMASMPAHAVYPVIDAAAIRQLVAQIDYWRQQIAAMQRELTQLQQTYAALTGGRGMERLLPLSDAERNYLPRDWSEVAQVLSGQSARYGQLARAVTAAMNAAAVLDDAALGRLGTGERDSVIEARRDAAALGVLTQDAYAQASARFAQLSALVSAIGTAADAKAIADLQGRIAAEQTMLENEQAKLGSLYQAMQARQWQAQAVLRERAIAGHGEFTARLRPTPP